MFGGRVDFVESLMLGIQDRRGHYIVIKCEDEKIAEKWQKYGIILRFSARPLKLNRFMFLLLDLCQSTQFKIFLKHS